MSCWVVPQVAAEIWGISLTEVLQRIHSGTVISKMEYGFLLVDTAPLGPLFRSTAAEGREKPRTWVEVRTWVECDEDGERIEDAGVDLHVETSVAAIEEELEDGDSIEEEADDGVALGWREKRIVNASRRRPPRSMGR